VPSVLEQYGQENTVDGSGRATYEATTPAGLDQRRPREFKLSSELNPALAELLDAGSG
jgi:hypothetical protein